MPVTLLTHQMIAREGAAMLSEEMHFSSRVNRGRESEFTESVNGYKKGDSVTIKVPGVPTQKHVGISFTAKERLLEIEDFKERLLRPAIRSLAATVEADLISQACKATPNIVGTPGTTPTTMKTFGQARQKLQMYLAPPSDRTCLITSEANLEMVDASKALFHKGDKIAQQWSSGSMLGEAQGAYWFESVNMPSFGNGADIAMTVNGASQTGSTLAVTGNTSVAVGQIFTLPAVYAVHPLTGAATTTLQQFVVTAASSSGTISIYPAITPTGPNKTVSASPTDTNALTFVGSASTSYARSLMFHRDAFSVAFAPLPVLAGCEGYTATMDGFSMRVMTGGSFNDDSESTRLDVLYGFAAVRPLHAAQIVQ
jgi:hypothetical protein